MCIIAAALHSAHNNILVCCCCGQSGLVVKMSSLDTSRCENSRQKFCVPELKSVAVICSCKRNGTASFSSQQRRGVFFVKRW